MVYIDFQKTPIFQPSEKILLEYAQKKAEYTQRFGNKTQQTAFEFLIRNDFEQLFNFLGDKIKDKSDETIRIILHSRYNNVKGA